MLVIFDCDGVLINSEEVALEADRALLADYGLVFSTQDYLEFASGLTYEDMMAKIRARHLEVNGAPLPDDFEPRLQQHYHELETRHMRAIEGVATLLRSLKDAGIPFCVASNSGQESLERKLRIVGLYDFFASHIYSKDSVARPKPFPDLFLYAAEQMGGYKPEDCVVVEDSITGVTAGTAADMRVVGFSHGAHRPKDYDLKLRAAGASETAPTMTGVMNALSRFLGVALKPQASFPQPSPGC